MPTIGFDIEFFVADNVSRKVIPICGLVGGNKKEHIIIPNSRAGGVPWEIHEDNVALEVNSPVFSDICLAERWLRNLHTDLAFDMKVAGFPVHPIGMSYQHQIKFTKKLLQKAGMQALEIGCDPDFSAYYKNGAVPRQIQTGSFESGQRYVGGHVHLGYNTHEHIPHHCAAKILDLITIQYSECVVQGRLETYGLGTYRPKPYGIEYRALSTGGLLGANLAVVASYWNLARELETNPQRLAEIYGEFEEEDWAILRDYHKKNDTQKRRMLEKSGKSLMEERIFDAPQDFGSKRLRAQIWDQFDTLPE